VVIGGTECVDRTDILSSDDCRIIGKSEADYIFLRRTVDELQGRTSAEESSSKVWFFTFFFWPLLILMQFFRITSFFLGVTSKWNPDSQHPSTLQFSASRLDISVDSARSNPVIQGLYCEARPQLMAEHPE